MADNTALNSPAATPEFPEATEAEVTAEGEALPGEQVEVVVPAEGTVSVAVDPGDTVVLRGLRGGDAKFTQEGGDLVVSNLAGTSYVVLEDYLVMSETDLPPALTLDDGVVIDRDTLYGTIENLDLDAIAAAAGGGAGGGGGGASFNIYGPGDIGTGLSVQDLLRPTGLPFGKPFIDPKGEVEEEPPPDGFPSIKAFDSARDESDGMGSVDGRLRFDHGPDGPGSLVLAADGATWDGQTLAADDGSWSIVVNDDGTYSFTQLAAMIHPDGYDHDDPLFFDVTATVTDADGDEATDDFRVTVYDDGPRIEAVSDQVVDETGGLDTVQGTLAYAFGTDGVGALTLMADGATWDGQTLTAGDGSWKITVNDGGTYTFTQLAAMMHPDGSDHDDVLFVDVTAMAVDGDGDFISDAFRVAIHDDGPRIEAVSDASVDETGGFDSVTGTLAHGFGADGAGGLALAADNATWDGQTLMADDGSWKIVANANGTYTFTQLAAMMHPDDQDHDDVLHVDVTATVTDKDGDIATDAFHVTIHDDGPRIEAVSDQIVDETGGLDSVDGTLDFAYGTDGAGSLALTANGATWDGQTLTADDGSWKIVANANGTYTFTQLAAMTHPDGGDPDDELFIDVTATVTDKDGDWATEGFRITVSDDGPTAAVSTAGVSVLHDESPGIQNTPADDGDDVAAATAPAVIPSYATTDHPLLGVALSDAAISTAGSAYGADGAGSMEVELTDLGGNAFDGDYSGLRVTGGNAIHLYSETRTVGNEDHDVIVGREGDGSDADPEGQVAFVIHLDGDNKVWVGQFSPIHHGHGGTEHDESEELGDWIGHDEVFTGLIYAKVTVKDADTDVDTAVSRDPISVMFDDDGPTITAGDAAVDEDGLDNGLEGGPGDMPGTAYSDTGTLEVTPGTDGLGSLSIALNTTGLTSRGDAVSWNALTNTATAGGRDVFTIEDNGNGTYTFTLIDVLDHGVADTEDDLNLSFTATVMDGDGDTDFADFTVTIDDDSPAYVHHTDGVMANLVGAEPPAAQALQGVLEVAFGADGPKAVGFDFTAMAGVATQNAVDGGGNPLPLESGGNQVYYYVDPANPHLLVASTTQATGGTYLTTPPTTGLVFTLIANGDGIYDFELLDEVDGAVETIETPITAGYVDSGNTDIYHLPMGDAMILTFSSPDGSINTSGKGLGIHQNWIKPGETLVIDMSQGVDVISLDVSDIHTSATTSAYTWKAYDASNNEYTGTGAIDLNNPDLDQITVSVTDTNGDFIEIVQAQITVADGYDWINLNGGVSVTFASEMGDVDLTFAYDAIDGDGDAIPGSLDMKLSGYDSEEHMELLGDDGDEVMVGSFGEDEFTGGGGDDLLYANAGVGTDDASDTFFYTSLENGMDTIYNFETGSDVLDLSGLFEELGIDQNQADHVVIDNDTANNQATVTILADASDPTSAYAEFMITLDGVDSLTLNDIDVDATTT